MIVRNISDGHIDTIAMSANMLRSQSLSCLDGQARERDVYVLFQARQHIVYIGFHATQNVFRVVGNELVSCYLFV